MTVFNLKIDPSAVSKAYAARLGDIVKKTCFELAERVVTRTPVDTGFARGSWYSAIGSASPKAGAPDPSGGAALAAMSAIFLDIKGGEKVYVLNNCQYIEALEYGHSKQAPQGMVRRTIQEAPQIVATIVGKLKT